MKSTAAWPKKLPCAISLRRTFRSKHGSTLFGAWSCSTISGRSTDFSEDRKSNVEAYFRFYLRVQRAGRAAYERNHRGGGNRADSDLFPSRGNVLAPA